MEVHPPDHPVMSWNQFFVHMAIVVLGLLIAIGLEQSVEALHHRHQRAELREGLQGELKQQVQDATKVAQYYTNLAMNLGLTIAATQDAYDRHQPVPALVRKYPMPTDWNDPSDPSFRAAKASGLLALLSQDEVRVFSEIDTNIEELLDDYKEKAPIANRMSEFYARFGHPGAEGNRWAQAAPDDVRRYMAALAEYQSQCEEFALTLISIRASSEQALRGCAT